MEKSWPENAQKAQGMVEFALVLPILLLLILGIIGFGHLFFVYSSTVSASREAGRFGAAVGVTQNNIPHFQDCNAIRQAAVNVGRFAGVTNTAASVNISYDKGPGTTATDPLTSCPVNGTGPDVELGDRIIIQVNIQYRSIVPIVNIPNFPLTATTRRTIVRSLQIGDAPTAEPVCPLTDVYITIMGEDSATHTLHSVVGQAVPIDIDVLADSPPHPTTNDGLYLFDSTLDPPVFPQQIFNAPSGSYSYTYMHAGNYLLSGQYVGDIVQCYDDSSLSNQLHVVDAADTLLTISYPHQDEKFSKQPGVPLQLPVTVTLAAVSPGARPS
ncbi:MAG: pilus assembly protein, partial [Anaerolineaceae bacterium]|nr:pilus assembly protein [Anaerolineaceae bacterium]